MSISPAHRQCSYIHLHQLRTWSETLKQTLALMGLLFFFSVCGSAHLVAVLLPNVLRANWDVHTLGRWRLVSHRHVESIREVFPPRVLVIFVPFWALRYLSKPVFGLRLVFSFSRCKPVLTLCFITGLCKAGGRLGAPR